jgi:hypothetical protein
MAGVTDPSPSTSDASTRALPAGPDVRQSKLLLWLGVVFLAGLFVLLRWNSFAAPLTRDEGEYSYAAQLLLGGGLPYEMSFLQKPPMVAYSYALAELLAPDVFWVPRIAAILFAAGATVLLGYMARKEFGPGVAMPAMWLMTPMILMPKLDQFIANTETFMLLPLMATVAVYVHSRHSQGRAAYWLAAGSLAALTFWYKYTVFPLLASVFVLWSLEDWRGGKRARAITGNWLAALAGGTAATVLVLAPFLLRDGGKRLWECTVVFNRFYAAWAGFAMAGLWQTVAQFWDSWWLLFLALCLLIFKFERRVWFWVVLFAVAWLASFGSYYLHYYIPIMPFWALLIAVGIRGFAGWVALKNARPLPWLRLALTGLVVAAVCGPDVSWLIRMPEQFTADRLGLDGTFLESPLVAARLVKLTTSRDFVYVAGSEPQILCYAHRFSPTRFDIAYPLMIPTPLAKGYQAEAILALQQVPPAAIVLVRTETSWLTQGNSPPDFRNFLQKLLAEKYELLGATFAAGGKSVGSNDLASRTWSTAK